MARVIRYLGNSIREDHLVIGNHSHAQVIIKGDFAIKGLVYCPRYKVDLIIKGNGTLSLHGVCKQLNIVKVKGNCVLEFESLSISELNCCEMIGLSVLKIGKVKNIGQRNIGDSHLLLQGRKNEYQSRVHYSSPVRL
jgi:hypothetical protein